MLHFHPAGSQATFSFGIKNHKDHSQGLHTWKDCFNLQSIYLRRPKNSSCTLVHWGSIGSCDRHLLSATINTQSWKEAFGFWELPIWGFKRFYSMGTDSNSPFKRGLKKCVSCVPANSPHLCCAALKLRYNICWYGALNTQKTKHSNIPAEINNEVKIQTPYLKYLCLCLHSVMQA